MQELSLKLKEKNITSKSTSIYFASTDECTMNDIKARTTAKCSNTSGWKIPINMLTNPTKLGNAFFFCYTVKLVSGALEYHSARMLI